MERDLKDTSEGAVSSYWRFGIGYNAALKLCTILLHAEGFKAGRALQRYRTIQALPLILGSKRKRDAQYLDACRAKRNVLEYDYVGSVTQDDAGELVAFVRELKDDTRLALKRNIPS